MEHATKTERTTQPHDAALRKALLDLRGCPGWSNNIIAKRLGVSSAQVSQYLNDAGCIYEGDIPKLERSINDLLDNETRRRSSGVETKQSIIT